MRWPVSAGSFQKKVPSVKTCVSHSLVKHLCLKFIEGAFQNLLTIFL